MGWQTIHAAIYTPKGEESMFDFFANIAGKQFVWILLASLLAFLVLLIDYSFWNQIPPIIYGISFILLVAVLIFGVETGGARAWFKIGPIKIQPAEFAKLANCLMIAYIFDKMKVKIGLNQGTFVAIMILIVPCFLILLEKETGSVLVFSALIIMFYREGLHPAIPVTGIIFVLLFYASFIFGEDYVTIFIAVAGALTLGVLFFLKKQTITYFVTIGIIAGSIGFVRGANYLVDHLQTHQKNRIYALFDPYKYKTDEGYQASQSMMAIGHGKLTGRGHLNGELTQMDQVPEQFTDFIFCTIGEEQGWIGSSLVILVYLAFLGRLIYIAERQKTRFARVYGYCVASILFFHFTINIGMTISIFPVIGIPLPFFSYGGSSLITFTLLVFILLKCDMQRSTLLGRV